MNLGRLLLPSELRKELEWTPGDKIEIHRLDKNTIVLKNTFHREQKKQAVTFTSSD